MGEGRDRVLLGDKTPWIVNCIKDGFRKNNAVDNTAIENMDMFYYSYSQVETKVG